MSKNINEILENMPQEYKKTYLGFCEILGKKLNITFEEFTDEQKSSALQLLYIELEKRWK